MGIEDLQSPEGQQALEALGVVSEEVAAEEKQAVSALARALGHNHGYHRPTHERGVEIPRRGGGNPCTVRCQD